MTLQDRMFKTAIYRCDICDDEITEALDNFGARMQILDDIDNSYASELDRSKDEQGPKLILCDYCQKEYDIPSWLSQ
jgi:hypothetical protein